ncbi:guanine nucleotide exchange factor [Gautieria morchelliformis]|nr:guanine nucleotide exchange factor [Gautieria morchelliformis]
MPNPLVSSYLELTQASSRSRVLSAIQNIINAPIDAFSPEEKQQLVQALLNDVKDGKARLLQRDTPLALLALKTLGRNPTASRVIVAPQNLQILLTLGTDSRESHAEAAHEAMRCVANALLLIDTGRDSWLDIRGGEACVEMLERSPSPQSIFLASRILFLTTVKQTPFTRRLVEELRIVDIMSQRLDSLMNSILSGQAMAKEAMVDTLKFTFNLLLQYPRMVEAEEDTGEGRQDTPQSGSMRELWNANLENLLPPLLRAFNGLPPTFPCPLAQPLTHVIHALITIPVAPLASRWFSPAPSPTSTPRSLPSDKFHKALSALAPGRRSQSSSRPSSPAPPAPRDAVARRDTVQRAWDLLDITTAHYVPGDPDDPAARQLCKSEGIVLDDTLTPLVVLLTRLAAGDESARLRMKAWVLPSDLDRTKPLEEREDLLGRCIRLMSCVYFSRIKDSIGELLFTICDSDASTLAGQIGYGNCAGFLFNKGIMAPPESATDAEGVAINPITGIRNQHRPSPGDEMTEEEKEVEAEKLFVLFERLEKSGMGVNPIRKAQQQGKLEEIS